MATIVNASQHAGLGGTMMETPLTVHFLLEHAVRNHPARAIVARDGDAVVRLTYASFAQRVGRLTHALRRLGVGPGDRVAAFGWNTHRYLELYYAVPIVGAVLHTINVRLAPHAVAEMLQHAGDGTIFADASCLRTLGAALETAPDLARLPLVVMGRADDAPPGAHVYESLLASEPATLAAYDVPERAAATLCYTSATTGEGKGVLFSHRSVVLHAFASAMVDGLAISQRDTICAIVPLFHVNAWGLPYCAPMIGAKIVLPGGALDPAALCALLDAEGVTFAVGVPTVWLAVRDYLHAGGARPAALQRVVIGGSAVPPKLFDDLEALGIAVTHAWGMTETSPIGTVNYPKIELDARAPAERRAKRLKQGCFSPIVAWRVVDEGGADVAADGTTRGELLVRGPAVAGSYFDNPPATAAAFVDGWFRTGDIVTVDADGYLEIVDRVKDMIKSGGEWISSVELENALMGHPAVREACVFGVPHPTWIERPVAAVVLHAGAALTAQEAPAALRAWLGGRVANWQVPDRVLVVEAIPRTGVGKFLKRALREQYAGLLTSG